jgi:hypothetical protein
MYLPLPRNKKDTPMGKGGDQMATVIEYIEGHYDVEASSYGEAYIWCPAHIVVECDCGQRKALSGSHTVCSCGADHAALVREALAYLRVSHPWEVDYQEWRRNLGEFLLSEEIYQRELSRLD